MPDLLVKHLIRQFYFDRNPNFQWVDFIKIQYYQYYLRVNSQK